MKEKLRKLSTIFLLAILLVVPIFAFADDIPIGGSNSSNAQPRLLDPLGSGGKSLTLGVLIPKVITALLQIGIIVIVMAFIYAGFLYVTALGDEKQIGKAHLVFKYTVIGAAVLLGSSVLATAIRGTIDAIRSATQ